MIIILKLRPTTEEIAAVEARVKELGYEPHKIVGEIRTVIACVGDETENSDLMSMKSMNEVEQVMPIQKKHKLVSRDAHPDPVHVPVGDLRVGEGSFHVIAGPCSVESREQILAAAHGVKKHGATMLRGGAFKPRTSPYDFQGLGKKGLELLAEAKAETGLPIVTEIVSETHLDMICEVADVLQVGARNALNYSLLTTIAQSGKPILLKRGLSATIKEWLLAAEYIVSKGNHNVMLCERGIRTYETATRNTLDLNAVAVAKLETSLPVIVDPSHGTGRSDLLLPMSRAAAAVGADGIIIEIHPEPEVALSDSAQQITPDEFGELMEGLKPFIEAAGKELVTA